MPIPSNLRSKGWHLLLAGGLFLWSAAAHAQVQVGGPAPDFCLPPASDADIAGEQVCLRDFRGKQNVLLLFYILDFTPG